MNRKKETRSSTVRWTLDVGAVLCFAAVYLVVFSDRVREEEDYMAGVFVLIAPLSATFGLFYRRIGMWVALIASPLLVVWSAIYHLFLEHRAANGVPDYTSLNLLLVAAALAMIGVPGLIDWNRNRIISGRLKRQRDEAARLQTAK